MKIAMLSTFYPFRGGIAQFNANLHAALERDHEVLPFTFKRQYPDFLFPGKTQYVERGDDAPFINSIPVLDTANPFSYAGSAKRIIDGKPDILIMKYWMSYLAPSLGTIARRLKKRGCTVITILDNVVPHEKKFFDRPLTSWFLKQNSGFITMSESVRSDLLALRPDAKSAVVPHPLYDHFGDRVDVREARERLGIATDRKTLLFFGLIRDYKGLDLLIDAMNFLDDSYQLVVAGESYGSFDKYSEQISRVRSPERIKIFNRYIDDGEVPLFFSASDLCVLPYRSATQSGVTSIACHFELPLIATDTGGLRESIGDRGTGLMIPDISGESIAATVRSFYGRNRSEFVSGIRREKSLLTWGNFADRLLSFAREL